MLVGYAVNPVGAGATTPTRATAVSWGISVTRMINSFRTDHGLAPLQARANLVSIAHAHNVKMAAYNRATHQLPGELPARTRISHAGYSAGTAGENVAQTATMTSVGVILVQRALNAHGGANSPRANILNRAFRFVGVDVTVDAVHGKLWVTEDFATVPSQPPPATVTMAASMLSTMNAERAQHGLPTLRMNANLTRSAHSHNLRMASYNLMSHLLPGELSFLSRLLVAGYSPRTAGENIGWNSDRSLAGVPYLQRIMYNEVPPNDAHRRNILNPSFREAGIDVYIDLAHGKLWVTQDLGLAG